MVKELLRNGSFERGNLDFWETYLSEAQVQTSRKKRGSYAVKIIASDYGWAILRSRDYIEVTPHSVYKHTGWYKNSTLTKMKAMVGFFDCDKDAISGEEEIIWEKSGAFDWTFGEGWFVIPIEASYLRFYVMGEGSQYDYGYVDCLSLQEVDLNRLSVYTRKLLEKTDFTSTGTFYSDTYFSGIWKTGEYYLNVENLTGTDPTLDVSIQSYDPSTGIWKDIVEFEQATGAGTQLKVATAGLGWQQRVKYMTGGTITDCDFKVGVVFKR